MTDGIPDHLLSDLDAAFGRVLAAARAQVLDAMHARVSTLVAAGGRAAPYAEFYNRSHDKLGRFAGSSSGAVEPGFKVNDLGLYEIDSDTARSFNEAAWDWRQDSGEETENNRQHALFSAWVATRGCKATRDAYKAAPPLAPFQKPRLSRTVQDFVDTIEQVPSQNVVAYRGVRGYDSDPAGWEAKIGSTVDWLAPGSSSVKPKVATQFTRSANPVMFEVHGRGAFFGDAFGMAREEEVVMPPGRYRVEGVRTVDVLLRPSDKMTATLTVVTVRQEKFSWQPGAVAGFDPALAASAGASDDGFDRFVESPEYLVWNDDGPALVASAGDEPPAHVPNPDTVFDLDAWKRQVETEVGPSLERVLVDAANQAGIGVSFDVTDPRMATAVSRHVAGITAWGDEMRSTVARTIERGMTEGWSTDRMAEALADTGIMSETRGRLIARTEAIAAANAGSIEGWKLLGFITDKKWSSTPDERTRPTHIEADGQTVPLDGRFTIGGVDADYPGDPALPLKERVNCRCRMLAVEAADSELPPPAREPAETTVEAAPVTAADDAIDRLRVLDPGDHPGVDPAGWQFQTDPGLHALSLWSDPAGSRAIVQAQDDLVFGRVPSAALDDLVPLIREATGVLSSGQVQDHVLAAAGRLDGLVRSVPAPSTGPVYAGADAGPYRVGQMLGSVPRRWAATRPSGPVFELEPGAPVVQPAGAAALFVGPVMVTGVSGDRVSVRAVDEVAFAAAAGRASLYDAFYNKTSTSVTSRFTPPPAYDRFVETPDFLVWLEAPQGSVDSQFFNRNHDERGRFASTGSGSSDWRDVPSGNGIDRGVLTDLTPSDEVARLTNEFRSWRSVRDKTPDLNSQARALGSWVTHATSFREAWKGGEPDAPPGYYTQIGTGHLVEAFRTLPQADVVAYRGVRGYPPSQWTSDRVGESFTMLAPSSSSLAPEVARTFTQPGAEPPVLFEIRGRGAYIGDSEMSQFREAEVVMPPGKYRITAVQRASVERGGAKILGSNLRPFTLVQIEQVDVAWTIPDVLTNEATRPLVDEPTAQFANPNHDRRGRFARNGEGHAVPTDGIDMLRPPDPNQTELFAPPPGTLTEVGTIARGKIYRYDSDLGSTFVGIEDASGWSHDDPILHRLIRASQGHDPKVELHFVDGTESPSLFQAATHYGNPKKIILPPRSGFKTVPSDDPEFGMPALTADRVPEYDMAHEHGHIATYRSPKFEPDRIQGKTTIEWEVAQYVDRMAAIRPSPKAMKEQGIPWDQQYDFEQNYQRRKIGLSKYAMTSPLEAIAEAYAQAFIDPAGLTPGAREVLRIAGIAPAGVDVAEPVAVAASAGSTEPEYVYTPRSDMQLRQGDLLIDVRGPLLPAIDLAAWGHPERTAKEPSTQFANPNHDQRGRFARKGEGVAGGLDGIDMLAPAGSEIRHDPEFPVKEGFRRVPTHDDRLAAAAERGIAIPPGWTNVQVSVDPHAPGLRARGVDSKGRVQPRYSEEHKRSQAAEKFQRIAQFQRYAEHLDENLRRDHATDPTAGALVLMRRLGIRPGSDADKRAAKKAYGATTLEVRHVTFDGDQVTLKFDSKKGGHTVIATRDRLVIDTLRAHTARKKPGDRIFDTTDRRTNDYIDASMPSGAPTFTNKDLRTVVGTGRARRIVAHMRRPVTVAAARKARLEVARKVAKVLGNDPGEALRSYIAPEVFDAAGWAA